ncbi:hypothetical protein ACWDZ4_28555 [Streptomyces sp. NPDC003016]
MTFADEPSSDLRPSEAPASVIVSALRWDILNEWVRYLNDDKYPAKTAEMSYVGGFINRDSGGDALRCLWSKHETAYPLFAETVWLLHREFSEGSGTEHHALFAGLPPIPSDILFRKIANSSAVAFRKLTEAQMIEILRKAPNDYAAMR